jgi:hypothetical protein
MPSEVVLVQGTDKVFRVFINGKVVSESWEYRDALEYFKAKMLTDEEHLELQPRI